MDQAFKDAYQNAVRENKTLKEEIERLRELIDKQCDAKTVANWQAAAERWQKVLEIKAAYGRHDIYRESDALEKIFNLTRETE